MASDTCEPPRKLPKIDERRIIPILGEATTSETLPLAEFYIVYLQDKKKISPFMKKIPLVSEKFDHLKRVDKTGRILVQPADATISLELLQNLKEFEVEEKDLQMTKVAACKPATRRQFEWAKQYWPTCFHPDKDNKELTSGSRTGRLLGHPVMTMVQNLAQCQRRDCDYLATGCDVYLRDEPCAMCAMALVHCRAARVFYTRNSTNGVLAQGKWQLHLEPVINHHYRVFHVDFAAQEDQTIKCGM
ncbi:hypothetical protein ANCDUO_06203 [Ancylostoma duodenale]|uniref:Uncharacterized protein n=1 Tax=Ancylostoma duodenale TaxID=51022 RepID=A0A0C2GQ89_9BILA|nr:hypothetical protein ANCDUO_06203 [Ancylostoma duodenale]